ncbi:hypothetical protein [Streptomyces lunalinharesii]|uniref:hypothetical protein n=1 Tax=Streptomyces lunalinharesii TaxID=333384 RepID=UPI0031D85110
MRQPLFFGYRIEEAAGRGALRIVTVKPEPSLLSGGAAHRTVVGAMKSMPIGGSDAVVEAMVRDPNT